jgi:hypothetical protein
MVIHLHLNLHLRTRDGITFGESINTRQYSSPRAVSATYTATCNDGELEWAETFVARSSWKRLYTTCWITLQDVGKPLLPMVPRGRDTSAATAKSNCVAECSFVAVKHFVYIPPTNGKLVKVGISAIWPRTALQLDRFSVLAVFTW